MRMYFTFGLSALLVLLVCGCTNQDRKATPYGGSVVSSSEFLRYELETPGGPLPFVAERIAQAEPFSAGIRIFNGSEEIRIPAALTHTTSEHSTIDFPSFDASLRVDNATGEGVYTKERGDSVAEVPLRTKPAATPTDRFDREHPIDPSAISAIDGRWIVDFADAHDEALGIFEVDTDGHATGTFLTATGDYRFLDGVVDGRTLKLSCFDGGHAFLFHAELQDDGTLAGDFWSGNWYHDTWTARPAPEGFAMPDGFELSTWQQDAGLEGLTFTVAEENGDPATLEDIIEANGGYPAIIEVFGSWCPNCHDAAAAIQSLRAEFGITVVGLAFELTPDFQRSVRQIEAFMAKHDADWPVLLAGVADKDKASNALPALDRVRAYPTTIFVNAAGEVETVHTGFVGPAAPAEHAALMARLRETTRRLMEEAPSPGSETPGSE